MMTTATRMAALDRIVKSFPPDFQVPMREFAMWMDEDTRVSHQDFSELKMTVTRIAVLQQNTEHSLDELRGEVKKLAEAQVRTEAKVEQLAEAQDRLAEAQTRTEQEICELRKSLTDQIAALDSRWGIYNEGTFRSTIYGVLQKMEGVTVKEGWYNDRQVDVVIRDGEHILLEITSRMHAKDIDRLYKSAEDYEQKESIRPKLMVATSYVSPKLMQKIMGLDRTIEIFSYEGEE